MVQKNLIIFLVLLWIMPQFTAKRSVIPQFRKMNKVNYRQEDDIINSHNHAHHLRAVCIEHLEMVKLTSQDQKEI